MTGDVLTFIDVHLEKQNIRKLARQRRKHRRNHLARPTPRRGEVYKDELTLLDRPLVLCQVVNLSNSRLDGGLVERRPARVQRRRNRRIPWKRIVQLRERHICFRKPRQRRQRVRPSHLSLYETPVSLQRFIRVGQRFFVRPRRALTRRPITKQKRRPGGRRPIPPPPLPVPPLPPLPSIAASGTLITVLFESATYETGSS